MSINGTRSFKRKVTPNKQEPNFKAPKLNKKIEKSSSDFKSMKKTDLILYCEKLTSQNTDVIAKNVKLKELNKKHVDQIHIHEKNIQELKEKCANTIVYLCGECDYVADCIHDFNDHTHSPDNLSELDFDCFNCNFCDEIFEAHESYQTSSYEQYSTLQ